MAKAPAYQWYPGDWRRDLAVQSCSFEARSLWREMLDLMHDGEPYGHLTANGVPIDEATLARLVGVDKRKISRWMSELETREVFSRTDAGIVYSRRMVRDEEIRRKRAAGGKLGGNPALKKGGQKDKRKVNLPPNLPPTPAVASASATASATAKTAAAPRTPVRDGSMSPEEAYASAAFDTLNDALQSKHGEHAESVPSDHGSRQSVLEWQQQGVPLELVTQVIAAKVAATSSQIRSMRYFDQAVLEAHDRKQNGNGNGNHGGNGTRASRSPRAAAAAGRTGKNERRRRPHGA